ncbi:bis(5'-nucleosyl)-tetraphosphatase PrpE [asymmetrical]-like [Clytia hemisphaerica]|uniref:bis(5'-nucleosyl)-tetraphosphatase PrpE [asymmetrical]-like n=1 Tax=Clytia hemisphaerica TaxID=252671 RepID=UPI0034D75DC6
MAALVPSFISLLSQFSRIIIRHSSSKSYDVKKLIIPLPKTSHIVLSNEVVRDRKLFFIGDVHGCLDELKELLQKVNERFSTEEYLPIFVGDLVNKGPENVGSLQYVRNLEHFAVKGNHDAAALREVLMIEKHNDYDPPARWQWVKGLNCDDIDYLKELPYTLSFPDFNAIVVHAGLLPKVDLENQSIKDMILMRNIVELDAENYQSAESLDQGKPWASLWPGPEHIYFGHDARRKFQSYEFATGLDTGCVYGNQLTGLLLDKDGTKEIIQVQAKSVYQKPTG